MKNKGFTTIELITSFTLASVIMLILFNIVLIMKDNLSKVNAMTNTLVEKDNLSYIINKRLKESELASLTMCSEGDKCYEFTYSDSTSDKLIYSNTDNTITFNNYTFSITDDMKVEAPTITEHYDTMSSTTYNGYFIIHIPIKVDNKDYSIKVNKHFNTSSLMVDLTPVVYIDNNGGRYNKVQYLESSGTQYIDTLVYISNNLTIKTNFSASNLDSAYTGVFGGRQSTSSKSIAVWKNGTNLRFDYNASNYSKNSILELDKKIYVVFDKENVYVDDSLVKSFSQYDFISDSTLTIFTIKNYLSDRYNNYTVNAVDTRFSSVKIYDFVIYDNDTLVRDYIPVIDSSNRPCLFDKVGKECYYNQGTGEFLYG